MSSQKRIPKFMDWATQKNKNCKRCS